MSEMWALIGCFDLNHFKSLYYVSYLDPDGFFIDALLELVLDPIKLPPILLFKKGKIYFIFYENNYIKKYLDSVELLMVE